MEDTHTILAAIVKGARDIISNEKNWTTGTYIRRPDERHVDFGDVLSCSYEDPNCRFCAAGALRAASVRAGYGLERGFHANDRVSEFVWKNPKAFSFNERLENPCVTIIDVNDGVGREAAIEVFDKFLEAGCPQIR